MAHNMNLMSINFAKFASKSTENTNSTNKYVKTRFLQELEIFNAMPDSIKIKNAFEVRASRHKAVVFFRFIRLPILTSTLKFAIFDGFIFST